MVFEDTSIALTPTRHIGTIAVLAKFPGYYGLTTEIPWSLMSADRPIVRALVPERAGTRHSPHLSHPCYTPILRHESAERASVCAREGRRSNDHLCVRGSIVKRKRKRKRNLSKTTHLQVPKPRLAAGSPKSAKPTANLLRLPASGPQARVHPPGAAEAVRKRSR